jgi:hypothetical protein
VGVTTGAGAVSRVVGATVGGSWALGILIALAFIPGVAMVFCELGGGARALILLFLGDGCDGKVKWELVFRLDIG